MERDFSDKIKSYKKKERTARIFVILLTVVPAIIAVAWMYLSNKELEISTHNTEKLQNELAKNFDLKLDTVQNSNDRDSILNRSIKSNEALEILSVNYVPSNISIYYYNKPGDNPRWVRSLISQGYKVDTLPSTDFSRSTANNAIWYGRGVDIKDCKIVALTLMRAGVPVKAIRIFKKAMSDSLYKRNRIEIGSDKRLDLRNFPLLSSEQVERASSFPHEDF